MDFISLMEVTTTAGTTTYVIDEDRKIDKGHLKNVGKTSLVTSTTTIAGQISEKMTLKRIHERSAAAYVESMSDEELERALTALNLLEEQENVKDSSKTI